MSTIFCDNDGCMFSDGCGFCDCDKLSIVGGVCEGSMHGGRNASDGDIDERLKAENAMLRELLRNALTYIEYEGCGVECPETGHGSILTSCDTCNRYETESCAYVIAQSARELGIEAKE